MSLVIPRAILGVTAMAIALAVGFVSSEFVIVRARAAQRAEWWHDPNTQFDAVLGWCPVPNRRLEQVWGGVSSNRLGFRSPEVDNTKSQIVILGDSIAWGYGVRDQDTLSAFLERYMAKRGYQVSNLGVSGYGVDQEYLYFQRHVNVFEALRYVILVLCADNDLEDTASNVRYGKRKPLFIPAGEALILTGVPIRQLCLRNALSLGLFERAIARWPLVARGIRWVVGDRTLERSAAQRVVAGVLRKTADMVQQRGARFTVLLVPSRADVQEPSSDYRWFQQLLREEGYETVDALPILQDHAFELERFYLDPWHFSAAGHQLLAGALSRSW